MLVDSHCHLEYEGLVEDQDAALDRAREAGIEAFLNISTKRAEWDQVVGTAKAKRDVYASVGIHPHNADDHADLTREELLAATHDAKVIGIGETGLDYYYDHSDRAVQQDLFRLHIMSYRKPDGSFSATPTTESKSMRSNTDITVGPRWTTATYVLILSLEDDNVPYLIDGKAKSSSKGRMRRVRLKPRRPKTGGN